MKLNVSKDQLLMSVDGTDYVFKKKRPPRCPLCDAYRHCHRLIPCDPGERLDGLYGCWKKAK